MITSVGYQGFLLLKQQTQDLVLGHGPGLGHHGAEPLHQLRVALRRIRTTVQQFSPALVLPKGVSDQRIGKTLRRLGMARDLDVLAERLEQGLLPQLPSGEVKRLKPMLRQLRRERQQAYEVLVEVLQSGVHLALVSQLQRWLKQPQFTPWGETPSHTWLFELQLPALAELFLHPGWFVQECGEEVETMHDLRKQIKGVRYRMENLHPVMGRGSNGCIRRSIGQFKRAQALLGDYNDLAVLGQAIDGQLGEAIGQELPQLAWLLAEQRRLCWVQWRPLAGRIAELGQRRQLVAAVLAEQGRLARGVRWHSRLQCVLRYGGRCFGRQPAADSH